MQGLVLHISKPSEQLMVRNRQNSPSTPFRTTACKFPRIILLAGQRSGSRGIVALSDAMSLSAPTQRRNVSSWLTSASQPKKSSSLIKTKRGARKLTEYLVPRSLAKRKTTIWSSQTSTLTSERNSPASSNDVRNNQKK